MTKFQFPMLSEPAHLALVTITSSSNQGMSSVRNKDLLKVNLNGHSRHLLTPICKATYISCLYVLFLYYDKRKETLHFKISICTTVIVICIIYYFFFFLCVCGGGMISTKLNKKRKHPKYMRMLIVLG